MAEKKKPKKKVTTLAKKSPLQAKSSANVKGGGPGTQTEDDIYVGVRRR